MKVEDHPVEPLKHRIRRHHTNVIHGVRITRDRHAGLVIGIDGPSVGDDGQGIVLRHHVALDRYRTRNRGGFHEASECPEPGTGAAGVATQSRAEAIQFVESVTELVGDGGSGVDHTIGIIRRFV